MNIRGQNPPLSKIRKWARGFIKVKKGAGGGGVTRNIIFSSGTEHGPVKRNRLH